MVLTGEGKNFCFGGDLKGMMASGADVAAYLSELTTNLHAGIALLARLDAPVIAAINGTGCGRGSGLGAVRRSGDCSEERQVCAGLYGGGSHARRRLHVPAAAGGGLQTCHGIVLAEPRAQCAGSLGVGGLVNQVVEDENLVQSAAALAARLAAGPAGAFGAVKRLMAEADPGFETQLGRESRSIAARGMTPEGSEGIAAFLTKRAPQFLKQKQ